MSSPQFSSESAVLDISIVTFNSSRWLDMFFESLAAQHCPLDRLFIIARDNGSSDDTVARLEFWKNAWSARCRGFQIDVGANIGFGRGHNLNLARGSGVFFLVTNVDLTFEADALVRVLDVAAGDSPATACWELRQKPFEHPKIYHPVSLETLWCSSACVLFRRTALLSVQGYEPSLFLYGEDVELSYRLRAHGFALRYVPSAVCWHYTYEGEHDRKRAQFLGSKLANLLLRLRYGGALEILAAPFMYLVLWVAPPRVPQYYQALVAIGLAFLRQGPHFLATRRQRRAPFPFRGWDYEVTRPGAFVRLPEQTSEVPLVSLITRTMRGRHTQLRDALGSIANQTYPNVEVIVVEDGSSEAEAAVEAFRGRGAIAQLQYLSLDKVGRCRAGNLGLAAARGEFIGFLDDDDLLFADHVEVLVERLKSKPSCGAAYALGFEVSEQSLPQKAWGSQLVDYRVSLHQTFSRALLWDHNYLPIQAVLFRRGLYEVEGGFDETLENLEDWDLWIRYSGQCDFSFIRRVTSIYMVPPEASDAHRRLIQLASYRARVVQKNAWRWSKLSTPDATRYREEIRRYNTVLGLPRSWVRRMALSLPFAPHLFHLLRRAGTLITRQS